LRPRPRLKTAAKSVTAAVVVGEVVVVDVAKDVRKVLARWPSRP
jgi:hypothetical protein